MDVSENKQHPRKYEDKGIRQRLQGSTKIKKKDKYIKERQGLLSKTNIK